MTAENHLHQATAILGYYDELHPTVGHLLRVPALVNRGFYAARCRLARPTRGLTEPKVHTQAREKQEIKKLSHQIGSSGLQCQSCSSSVGLGAAGARRGRFQLLMSAETASAMRKETQ
jgi:hypothetical protein